jgi:hypothetical protein
MLPAVAPMPNTVQKRPSSPALPWSGPITYSGSATSTGPYRKKKTTVRASSPASGLLRAIAANPPARSDLGPPARVRVYELTDWGRELEPVIVHLGHWGSGAPLPDDGGWSLDSLLIALQGTADPAAVNGRYQLRIGSDVFAVDGTSGSVRVRRGTADRPEAILSTDADTLRAVTLGIRSIADAAASGDLTLHGQPRAVSGLTSLLEALTSSPRPDGEPVRGETQPARR